MKKTSVWMIVAALGAAATLAISLGCSGVSKGSSTTTITPKFLYTSNCAGNSSGSIGGFSIKASTGALTALTGSPFATGLSCPSWIAVNPAQTLLFVPDLDTTKVHVYGIGATGALTEISGSPYTQCAQQVAVDPSGKYLIAPDDCNSNVAVYSIGSTGALTAVSGSPFSGTHLSGPGTISIDPAGKFIYVGNNSGVSVFALGSSGALTEVTGSPFAAGSGRGAFLTPDGKYLYTTGGPNSTPILAFSVDSSTGAITEVGTGFAGGTCWIALDANSAVVFSTDCNTNLYSSTIGSDGSLTAATGSPVTDSGFPYAMIGDPSGKFFYAGGDSSSATISGYGYTSAGVMTALSGSPFGSGAYIYGMAVTH